jgi:alanyl-tRNA synthetase
VEALTGPRAWQFISQHLNILSTAAENLKIKPAELLTQLDRLQDQLKQKDKLAQALEEKLALAKAADLLAQAERVGSVNLIAKVIPDISADGLKTLADFLRGKGDDYVVILATELAADKVSIAAGVSNALVKRGINAGKLVKDIAAVCGGGGGGRPELAQAGGREPGKLNEALNKARELITQEVNAKA